MRDSDPSCFSTAASVDRAQGSGGRTAHSVHGFGGRLVRGEEDDQLLAVGGGEFEHFTFEPQLAEFGVTPYLRGRRDAGDGGGGVP